MKSLCVLACCFAVLVAPAVGHLSLQDAPYRISTFVEMVSLDVTVLDRQGGFVSGLEQDSFKVYEDGIPQQIKFFHNEDVPVTIGLVVDGSGSMLPKRSYVVSAAMAFAQESNPQDEIFTLYFNDDVKFGLAPGQAFTSDLEQLRGALLALKCEGRTALYDALAGALDHLKRGTFERKALLVVSDGEDNYSKTEFDDVLQRARQLGATIYTIAAYDPASVRHNAKILKRLAKVSGGQFYWPTTTPQIVSVCGQIAHDIRNRYTIAYTSTNSARDGTYRRILVKALSPRGKTLHVRVREGYFAPSAATVVEEPAAHR